MKFRLPFQIYRTGVISRSTYPEKIFIKFSKDNDAKVRKKTSIISYRTIISNLIFNLKKIPLKITLSKTRNRTKLKNSAKPRKVNVRNDLLCLQEILKDNNGYGKINVIVTNGTSEYCMNSIKCANFMCAKSTAKILLRQKDLLCNKNYNKEEGSSTENKNKKSGIINSTSKDEENKGTSNIIPLPPKKTENPLDLPIKDKYKPNEYKWKFNKSETLASSAELKHLETLSHNSNESRNYKREDEPPAPIRLDKIMGATNHPKKLPELPVQIVPKVEHVRPKEAPSLALPKRIYNAPETTRNYKTIEINHVPPRMDNLVGCKAEPKDMMGYHENITINSKHIMNKSYLLTEGIKDANELSLKNKSTIEMNKRNPMGNEKDAFLLKIDQIVHDSINKTKSSPKDSYLNTININVSNRIKTYEELIENKSNQPGCKSEEIKSRPTEEKLLVQGKQKENRDYGIFEPKLSSFAIAEIRRKYYPPENVGKEIRRAKQSMPSINAVPLMEPNDIKSNTRFIQLYSMSREQYKKPNENTSGNINYNHTKIKNSIINNGGAEKQKNLVTIEVDDSKDDDAPEDCSACSTIETPIANVIVPKVLIPPPTKISKAPANKSTSDSYDNGSTIERKFFANTKISREINTEASRGKNVIRIDSNNILQDLDNLKLDRKFSTDVLATNFENSGIHNCAIEVTSILDNKHAVSPVSEPEKMMRELNNQYNFEQCTFSKYTNNFEVGAINLPKNTLNKESSANIDINTVELVSNDRCNNMLNTKTTLINNYLSRKMQLQKFKNSRMKCSKPLKYSLNCKNNIDMQHKYRVKIFKIIQLKKKMIVRNSSSVRSEQNDLLNDTVNLLKSQVAHKCVLFDKISGALLKKTDIINYTNHANRSMQQEQKMEPLQHSKKQKLSRVPMLDNPPKKKVISVPEAKIIMRIPEMEENIPKPEIKQNYPVSETKNVLQVPETKKNIQPMEDDMPLLQEISSALPSSAEEEIRNKSRSGQVSRLDLLRTNTNNFQQYFFKNISPAIPATMKAKRYLAKIEAEPKETENILSQKADKRLKCQNSTKTKLSSTENMDKLV